MWVHPINKRRAEQGAYHNLVQELYLHNTRFFFFRMSSTDMENVLSYIGEDVRKQTTSFHVPVEPQQRLAVALK